MAEINENVNTSVDINKRLFLTAVAGSLAANKLKKTESVQKMPIGDKILNAKINSFWSIITNGNPTVKISATNNPLYYAQVYYNFFNEVKQAVSYSEADILSLALDKYQEEMDQTVQIPEKRVIFGLLSKRIKQSAQLEDELVKAINGKNYQSNMKIGDILKKARTFWDIIKDKNFNSVEDIAYAENLFNMCYDNEQRMHVFNAFLSYLTNSENEGIGRLSENRTNFDIEQISKIAGNVEKRVGEIKSRFEKLSSNKTTRIYDIRINPLLVEPSVSLETIKEIERIGDSSSNKNYFFMSIAKFINKNQDEGKTINTIFENISELSRSPQLNVVVARLKYYFAIKITAPNLKAGDLDNLSSFVSKLVSCAKENPNLSIVEILNGGNATALFQGNTVSTTAIDNMFTTFSSQNDFFGNAIERAKILKEITNKAQSANSYVKTALSAIETMYLNPSFNLSSIEIKPRKLAFDVREQRDKNGFPIQYQLNYNGEVRTITFEDFKKQYETKITKKRNVEQVVAIPIIKDSHAYLIPNGETVKIENKEYKGPVALTFSMNNSGNIGPITEMSRESFEAIYNLPGSNSWMKSYRPDYWNDSCKRGNSDKTMELISQVTNGYENVLLYSKKRTQSNSSNNSNNDVTQSFLNYNSIELNDAIMQGFLSGTEKTTFDELYSFTKQDFPLSAVINKTLSMVDNISSDTNNKTVKMIASSIMQLGVALKEKNLKPNQIGQLINSCNSIAEIQYLYEVANKNQNNSNPYQILQNAHDKFLSEHLFCTIGENGTIRFTQILKDTIQTLTLTQIQYENARFYNQNHDDDEQANKQSPHSPWDELCTYAKEQEKIEVITIKKSQGNPQNGKKPNNDSYSQTLNSLANAKVVRSSDLSSLDDYLGINIGIDSVNVNSTQPPGKANPRSYGGQRRFNPR